MTRHSWQYCKLSGLPFRQVVHLRSKFCSANMRIFCSICKDIFIPYSEVLVTNCGHLYHSSCITTWTGQHKTCPQCRANLSKPFRVYFDVDKDNATDPSTLEHELETISDKLRESERHKKKLSEDNKNYEKIIEGMKECAISLSKKNDILKTSVKALKDQVAKLTKKNEAINQLESEVKTWKAKVTTLERVEMLIKGSVEEVNKMIEDTPVSPLAVKQLCTYVGILKAQLHKLEEKNCRLAKENRDLSRKVSEEKLKYSFDSDEVRRLKVVNSSLERELVHVKTLYADYKEKNPEKKKETVPSSEAAQVKNVTKRPSFNIDFDFDDEKTTVDSLHRQQSDRAINNWEELICGGPSKNYGLPVKMSRSFSKPINILKENKDIRCDDTYAFDGLGGRKKLRLGGPTPVEEFGLIKKKKNKKIVEPAFQYRKIVDYCQSNK